MGTYDGNKPVGAFLDALTAHGLVKTCDVSSFGCNV